MFEPQFGRDIAAFGVVSIEMEFFGIPTRSPGIRRRSVRGKRSPYFCKPRSRHQRLRSFLPDKSILLCLLFASFRVSRGLKFQAADVFDVCRLAGAIERDENR